MSLKPGDPMPGVIRVAFPRSERVKMLVGQLREELKHMPITTMVDTCTLDDIFGKILNQIDYDVAMWCQQELLRAMRDYFPQRLTLDESGRTMPL